MTSNNYGLNNDMDYYEYVFDSYEATQPYNPFTSSIDWPLFLVGGKQPLKNVAALKLLDCQIPFTFYTLFLNTDGTTNCKFTYTDAGGSTTATLAIGNYTATQMATNLQNALNAAATTTGGGNAYTVTYSSILGKFVITRSAGASAWTLTFATGIDASPAFYLGFPTGSTSNSGATMTSPNAAQVSGPNYLYLNSRTIGTLANQYGPQTTNQVSGNAGPNLAKIPVNVSPSGIIYWQDPDPQKYFNFQALTSLTQLDFYFTLGTSTRILNFNGAPFSIKLGILLYNADKGKVQGGSNSRMITTA